MENNEKTAKQTEKQKHTESFQEKGILNKWRSTQSSNPKANVRVPECQ